MLFQFDSAELDFGIYRTLNYKRQQVEEFITVRLPEIIDTAFTHYAEADRAAEGRELKQLEQEVRRTLGEQAFDERGQLLLMFRETPMGKKYLEAAAKAQTEHIAEELRTSVYNSLFTFFSRYYEDGDFVSKRRYGREARYVIPYAGEEVLLHWANRDQYYIKTGEHLKGYRFTAGDFTVEFILRHASVEANNKKGAKRYFVLADEKPVEWQSDAKTFIVAFEYRALTEKEQNTYGKTENQKPQDKLNEAAEKTILGRATNPMLKMLLAEMDGSNGQMAIGKHLTRFTRRHTTDFFIHKHLGDFLRRELDFFLKHEVLLLDELLGSDVEAQSDAVLQRCLQRARVVRDVAERIIDFLAQVEDFQKRLFEKKKFVTRTEYCLTVDRVPKVLWDDVLQNKAQIEEWRCLYALDDLQEQDGLLNSGVDKALLKLHPTLVVDTRHFDDAFKWQLLSHFDDLEDAIDGVLIKSENWQALNLLLEKYRGKIKCIYIDPPYNTGSDEFIYKDNYQHSCWLTMMSDRLALAREWMQEDGVIFASIDDHEAHRFRALCEVLYGQDTNGAKRQQFVGLLPTVQNLKGNNDQFGFAGTHEYTLVYVKNAEQAVLNELPLDLVDIEEEYNLEDEYGRYKVGAPLKSTGGNAPREKRPNLFYPIYVGPNDEVKLEGEKGFTKVLPITSGQEMSWRWSKDYLSSHLHDVIVKRNENGEISLYRKQRLGAVSEAEFLQTYKPKSILYRPEYSSTTGTETLKDIMNNRVYNNPKSVELIKDLVFVGTRANSIILDFFAGSGTTAHAVINLNKQNGDSHKYILVEMGDWFETVLLPRVKKVVFCEKWKEGKPAGGMGISHVFKYHYLEQYEDTLNNLALMREQDGQQMLEMFGDEYLLRYMLDYETQGSPCLLNLDRMKVPFAYKLKLQEGDEISERTVDLMETFNYLLGLQVKKMRAFEDRGCPYRSVLGEDDGKRVVIVWRPLDGLEDNETALMQDKIFIQQTVLPALIDNGAPDRFLTNGPCFVEGAEAIEPEFKRLMFAEVT